MAAELHVLVRFADLLSRAAEPAEVMEALADAARVEIGADATLVVATNQAGELEIGATCGCERAPTDALAGLDAVGPELEERLRRLYGGEYGCVRTLPLASDRNLYGALVLLLRGPVGFSEEHLALASALAGLTASGLSRAANYAELVRSHAELRASRQVLARSQKLRALGEMAAGVSHDLKNILNPLSLHLQLLRRLIPRTSTDAQQSIDDMRKVLERGVETIERLRNFSRQSPETATRLVDLTALGHEALEIVRPRTRMTARAAFRLVEDGLDTPLLVRVDPAEAVAALVNLMLNAIDAMERGGTLTVQTGRDGDAVWVRVKDDGPGMNKEIEARVFEPFFTTKGEVGTGLGLAMVYGFVQRHLGTITLDTAPGAGATFTIRLPSGA